MGAVETMSARDPVPSRGIVSFLALTFLITWSVIGLYILVPQRASACDTMFTRADAVIEVIPDVDRTALPAPEVALADRVTDPRP